MTDTTTDLRLAALRVAYPAGDPARPALNDVSFTLDHGLSLGVIGESGSGKSTLGMTIAGFEHLSGAAITGGSIRVLGTEYRRSSSTRSAMPRRRPGVAMLFQDAMTSLDPLYRIGAQVKKAITARGRVGAAELERRIDAALNDVGVHDPDRVKRLYPYELSGGMRQRVMLAQVLLSEPDLLIADEPTSALDVGLTVMTMELLTTACRARGISLVLITHDIPVARRYVDRLLVLRHGEMVEFGPTDEVLENPRSDYARDLFACIPDLDSYRRPLLTTVES
ncbi:ABC transporter ATP-binding protein [Herbiconiux moechotypicola]|uniref:ABC transporter domain-containing protein n=1 Tax=Herbiconiux moechotypicola TaxID=637393 RepID=A0ABN3DPW0_9MICO|nr:ABC transporter ATP-binding protein [Herbiconiux moechotypicola]MCS5731683.1 ABC transporter ATP-binding protein [Herbiconiux moechotypicola]